MFNHRQIILIWIIFLILLFLSFLITWEGVRLLAFALLAFSAMIVDRKIKSNGRLW